MIKGDKVKTAQKKVDETKEIMKENVKLMASNIKDVEENLLPDSYLMAMQARDFNKNA